MYAMLLVNSIPKWNNNPTTRRGIRSFYVDTVCCAVSCRASRANPDGDEHANGRGSGTGERRTQNRTEPSQDLQGPKVKSIIARVGQRRKPWNRKQGRAPSRLALSSESCAAVRAPTPHHQSPPIHGEQAWRQVGVSPGFSPPIAPSSIWPLYFL